jgi:hypothetical protein
VTIFSAAQITVMEAILAGLSYKEAARLGGYSARSVSRWMQHDDRFQAELLRRLEDRKLQVGALRQVIADDRTPPSTRVNAVAMLTNLTTPTFDELGRPVGVMTPQEVNRIVRRRTHEKVSEYLLERR